MNFRPNCNWRDVVIVLVICPTLGGTLPPDVKTVNSLGSPKFARLSILNPSALNCMVSLSLTLFDFNNERSTVARPGPISTFLPTLPYCPGGGTAKAAGLKY